MKWYIFPLIALITFFSCKQHEQSALKTAKIFEEFKKDPIASRLPDFSYAGYHYGEKSIPDIQENIVNVAEHGIHSHNSLDQLDAIQHLIDSVGKAGGGVLFFPKGKYCLNMDTSQVRFLTIDYGNILIRGEGQGKDGTVFFNGSHTVQDEYPWLSPFIIRIGYKLQPTKKHWGLPGLKQDSVFIMTDNPGTGIHGMIYEAKILSEITADVPKGSSILKVNSTKGIKPRDIILVGQYNTSDSANLLKELLFPRKDFEPYMKSALSAGTDRIASHQFIIEVEKIVDETTIQLKQPVRRDLLMKYKPVVAESPMLHEIGIENVRFESAWDGIFIEHDYKNSTAHEARIMDYGWNAVDFVRVAHGWMRDVTFDNYINPVYLQDCRNVTMQDITITGPPGHAGIKIYGHCNDNLVQNIDVYAHFNHVVSGEGNCYGNVFRNYTYHGDSIVNFDCHGFSDKPFAPIGWNLYENFKGIKNIQGSGAPFNLPHSGTHNTYWNVEAKGFWNTTEIISAYKFRGTDRTDHHRFYPGSIIVGYSSKDTILTVDSSSEDRNTDWIYVEGLNQKVLPESLYEAQFILRTDRRK